MKKTNDLSISTSLASIEGNSKTEKKVHNVLPLLVFWRWDYTNVSYLDPELPLRNFTTAVQSAAKTKAAKQMLDGHNLELSVDSIPNIFIVNNRTNMIWLGFAVNWDKITVAPATGSLVVSYRLLSDSSVIKTGEVRIESNIQGVQKGYFQRLKHLTGDYLFQYDESIKVMSKKAMDAILKDL